MFSLIPRDDPKKAIRVRRFFMAISSYGMWSGIVVYLSLIGLFRLSFWETILFFALPLMAVQACVFIALRSGFSLRFQDPSLTLFQMSFATMVIMATIYFTDNARGLLLLIYLVTFVFGIFRLNVRQFLLLTVFAVASYGVAIAAIYVTHPETLDVRLEILQLIVLGTVLPWFALIGAYISSLRRKLNQTNADLSEALEKIAQLAVQDPLTEVYNRRKLMEILAREKNLVDRGGPAFALCMFDLDHFKHVNDTYGHLKGDLVLKTFGQMLKARLRLQDTFARYGGEEFILVLPQTRLEAAVIIAERARRLIADLRFEGLPDSFGITVSAGVTAFDRGETIDALFTRVDNAVYLAKERGRNQVQCFSTSDQACPPSKENA